MSELYIKNLRVEADGKTVVDGVFLSLKDGEVNVLMGPNGSGKSSLLNAIMGHPKYKITGGKILLDDKDITGISTEKKAQTGIFLSLQHLPEISGITLTNFLHKAYRAQKGGEMTPLDFYKMMEARAKEFGIDAGFLKKHLNAGLSGGEKKQSEVLQLLALEPKFALLDEIDSGVDVDALKKVFAAITALKARGVGFLLVSHHPNLLQHIKPDQVSVIKNGKIVATGGKELVGKIAREGFETVV
ncbi:MAG TPA: Fe-S cluster assembly ATPase SufC [Candidatus Paceibacterota bacterium]